jgi:hypothetical protein
MTSPSDQSFLSNLCFTIPETTKLSREVMALRTRFQNYTPILIQLDSQVLALKKNKMIVKSNLSTNEIYRGILELLTGLSSSDTLKISVVTNTLTESRATIDPEIFTNKESNIPISELYDKYHDVQTKFLVLVLSRQTTYKWLKECTWYYLGY